jgi:hypothetical protein
MIPQYTSSRRLQQVSSRSHKQSTGTKQQDKYFLLVPTASCFINRPSGTGTKGPPFARRVQVHAEDLPGKYYPACQLQLQLQLQSLTPALQQVLHVNTSQYSTLSDDAYKIKQQGKPPTYSSALPRIHPT